MSEGTGKLYPLTMICEVWRVARSTVYAARNGSKGAGLEPQKRGPKTDLSDEELLEEIREVLKKSKFLQAAEEDPDEEVETHRRTDCGGPGASGGGETSA